MEFNLNLALLKIDAFLSELGFCLEMISSSVFPQLMLIFGGLLLQNSKHFCAKN